MKQKKRNCEKENLLNLSEAAIEGVLYVNVFLEISQNSQENTRASLYFNKVASLFVVGSRVLPPSNATSYTCDCLRCYSVRLNLE